MRAVVQRVSGAAVSVDGQEIAAIGPGLLVLLGVSQQDGDSDVKFIVDKLRNLRVFPDSEGKLNVSVADCGGQILVVSQFTLYGDCRKGRRPSFTEAAKADKAEKLYEQVVQELADSGLVVRKGQFGANMQVSLVNDGPVTLLLDSQGKF